MTIKEVKFDFYDELFVAVRSGDFSKETFPLGFMTYDDGKAASKERIAKVLRWAGKKETDQGVMKFKNEPISGFKFENYASRYRTDNKWFEVNDPRGFQLQISAQNLVDLISKNTVVKGELQGDYVWARANSNNYLVESSRMTKADNKNQPSALVIGNCYEHSYGNKMVYLGKAVRTVISSGYIYLLNDGSLTKSLPPYNWRVSRNAYQSLKSVDVVDDDKPWFTFKGIMDHDKDVYYLYRSKPKLTSLNKTLSNCEIPYGEFSKTRASTSYYNEYSIFRKSKDDKMIDSEIFDFMCKKIDQQKFVYNGNLITASLV